MASSAAKTVDGYLAGLPEDRHAVIKAVRDLVNANLPAGYEEVMRWGMINWEVPLGRYPQTYNGQPLGLAGLAAQKRHYALYLSCVYGDAARDHALRTAYARAGKRLDMGKSCLRFKQLDDLVPEAIAKAIADTPVDALIAEYEASRRA